MSKRKLLTGVDMARISAGYEIESTKDYMFCALACFFLGNYCAEFAKRYNSNDPLVIEPDPVIRGLRMINYRDEAKSWRLKHPKMADYLLIKVKDLDFATMLDKVADGVMTVADFATLL